MPTNKKNLCVSNDFTVYRPLQLIYLLALYVPGLREVQERSKNFSMEGSGVRTSSVSPLLICPNTNDDMGCLLWPFRMAVCDSSVTPFIQVIIMALSPS